MSEIYYTVRLVVPRQQLINSVSHWLAHRLPFRVFENYQYRHCERLRELAVTHFHDYPHTRERGVEKTMAQAAEAVRSLFGVEKAREGK